MEGRPELRLLCAILLVAVFGMCGLARLFQRRIVVVLDPLEEPLLVKQDVESALHCPSQDLSDEQRIATRETANPPVARPLSQFHRAKVLSKSKSRFSRSGSAEAPPPRIGIGEARLQY